MSEQEEMDSFNGEASTSVIDTHMSYIYSYTEPIESKQNNVMGCYNSVLWTSFGCRGGDGRG